MENITAVTVTLNTLAKSKKRMRKSVKDVGKDLTVHVILSPSEKLCLGNM